MRKRVQLTLVILPTLFLILLSGCTGSSLPSGDAARGKALFADTTLGTNSSSCNTCHTDMGRGTKSLVGKRAYDHTIRDCIQGALQGDPGQDQAVSDLKAYIESLK
jgi:mono/diheme cytochrome c family protein